MAKSTHSSYVEAVSLPNDLFPGQAKSFIQLVSQYLCTFFSQKLKLITALLESSEGKITMVSQYLSTFFAENLPFLNQWKGDNDR